MSGIDRSVVRRYKLGEEPSMVDEYARFSVNERLEQFLEFRARVIGETMLLHKDLKDFIAMLLQREVRFLVVGGVAVNAHGFVRMTADFDFWVATDSINAAKVTDALREFGLGEFGADVFTREGEIVQFGRPPHRIDILTSITAVEFEAAYARRVMADMEGMRLPFIALDDLMRNKRAVGRPKDLADVHEFEASEKYRR
jgi:hypothetical protein